MNTKAHLIQTKKLLAEPSSWTKGTYWRDENGIAIDERYSVAGDIASMCLGGAMQIAIGEAESDLLGLDVSSEVIRCVMDSIEETCGKPMTIAAFNDLESTTHEGVLAVLDRAIEGAD